MNYIAASKQIFLKDNNQTTQDINEASRFRTFGDCMRACVEINNLIGKSIFKVYGTNN